MTTVINWSEEKLDALQRDLDAVLAREMADLGPKDEAHLKKVTGLARYCHWAGRGLLLLSFEPVGWALGVAHLTAYKILENMEIGHNVLHGQYDFLDNPKYQSKSYEWDMAPTAAGWQHEHNYLHHTYTNVIGKDRDFGYGIFRLSDDIPWQRKHLLQPLYNVLNAFFFQYAIANYCAGDDVSIGQRDRRDAKWRAYMGKQLRHIAKEYIFWPLLAGPFFWKVALGNFIADLGRNIWASSVIYCGHFGADAHTFEHIGDEQEHRGRWYLRQLLGSCNIKSGKYMQWASGHLSHQIEHHLFPTLPAWRYPKIAAEVGAICEKHGIYYNNRSMFRQLSGAWYRIVRYAFPGPGRPLAPQ
jgi:linoleoyl-CoA desaturase